MNSIRFSGKPWTRQEIFWGFKTLTLPFSPHRRKLDTWASSSIATVSSIASTTESSDCVGACCIRVTVIKFCISTFIYICNESLNIHIHAKHLSITIGVGGMAWFMSHIFKICICLTEIDFIHFWRIATQKSAKSIFWPGGSSENRILKFKVSVFVPGNPQCLWMALESWDWYTKASYQSILGCSESYRAYN